MSKELFENYRNNYSLKIGKAVFDALLKFSSSNKNLGGNIEIPIQLPLDSSMEAPWLTSIIVNLPRFHRMTESGEYVSVNLHEYIEEILKEQK